MDKEKYLPGYTQRRELLYQSANTSLIITMLFNMIRGFVSISFSLINGSFALLGFGIDAFVELAYGAVIWNIVQRSSEENFIDISDTEQKVLKITGIAFYVLAICLAITTAIIIIKGLSPDKATWGIIISIISIAVMFALYYYKAGLGKKLDSEIILFDAAYIKPSICLAVILFISSFGFALTGTAFFDSAGTLFLGIFIFIKGRKILQKIQAEPDKRIQVG